MQANNRQYTLSFNVHLPRNFDFFFFFDELVRRGIYIWWNHGRLVGDKGASNTQGAVVWQERNQNLLAETWYALKSDQPVNRHSASPTDGHQSWKQCDHVCSSRLFSIEQNFHPQLFQQLFTLSFHTPPVGKRYHCPFVFEWNKLSAWKKKSPKWWFSSKKVTLVADCATETRRGEGPLEAHLNLWEDDFPGLSCSTLQLPKYLDFFIVGSHVCDTIFTDKLGILFDLQYGLS